MENLFLTKLQRQLNGEQIVFSTNSAEQLDITRKHTHKNHFYTYVTPFIKIHSK